MTQKYAFSPGQWVKTFTGQAGMVVSPEQYRLARTSLKEGRRPGHFFAPGCCRNPDYRTQIPAVFEDGTYDVMRALNLRKTQEPDEVRKQRVLDTLRGLDPAAR